jgi:MFS family permease
MLIGGIALGLLLGLLLGGKIERLAAVRLRYLPLLFLAVIVRFGTEIALGAELPIAETLRVPLLALAYGLLLFTLWHNRWYPGLALALVGVAANGLAIMANGGYMPVWVPAFEASGLQPPLDSALHYPLDAELGPEFLLRMGPLGDIIPIPFPPFQNVASIGDLFLTAGLGFFLFATLLRDPDTMRRDFESASTGTYEGLAGVLRPGLPVEQEGGVAVRPGTGLTSALDEAIALQRPMVMGSGGIGLASPALAPLPVEEGSSRAAAMAARGLNAAALVRSKTAAPTWPVPAEAPAVPRPSITERIRQHPYIRLALNPSFSALWMGQVISLFGDRINQLALAAFVFELTGSALLTGMTFFAATVPNLFLSPIAGAYVDRWDKKQVLIVSDLLRAAIVLLVPVGVILHVSLAYLLIFVLTVVSLFFRPARAAILPQIVDEEDLVPANSALWVGDSIGDVIMYPIAGLFVVFLQQSIALAFWFDAATYLLSAALLATIVVPPAAKAAAGAVDSAGRSLTNELRDGWQFLRSETTLLANTLQSTAGQFSLGILITATFFIAKEITQEPGAAYRGTYAFIETAIGLGSLVGGFLIGAIAGQARKGLLITGSFIGFGVGAVLLGFVGSIPLVLVISALMGVANMGFVIPSQAMFQERTPPELMGRVVSFRFALVFGGMSLAMALTSIAIEVFTVSPVVVLAGIIALAAGVAGLGVKAVREAP